MRQRRGVAHRLSELRLLSWTTSLDPRGKVTSKAEALKRESNRESRTLIHVPHFSFCNRPVKFAKFSCNEDRLRCYGRRFWPTKFGSRSGNGAAGISIHQQALSGW